MGRNALRVLSLAATASAGVVVGVSKDLATVLWTRFQTRLYAGLKQPSSVSVTRSGTSTLPSQNAPVVVQPPNFERPND